MRVEFIRSLLRLLRPLSPLMVVSATSRVFNQGLGVAIPVLAVALVVGMGPGSATGGMLALLWGLALLKGTFRYLEQFTGHAVAFRLLAELRADTYDRIVPLAPVGLEEDRTGDLVSRVLGDVDRVEPFFAHTIAPLVSSITVPLLTTAGVAVWVDPCLGLVFLPFPLLALALPWIRARRLIDLTAGSRAGSGALAAVLSDTFQGAREVAVFGARDHILDQVDRVSAEVHDIKSRLAWLAAIRVSLGDLLATAAVVSVVVVGATRLEAGAIDLAGLAAGVTAAWVGMTPARGLDEIVPEMEQALAAAGRLFELAGRNPVVEPVSGAGSSPVGASVVMTGVKVRLGRSGLVALDEINLTIAEGTRVAVVGPSGSGKSTLVELLVRFRDPDEGEVALGGADLRSVPSALLSDVVALVPQRPDIYYGTLGENLRLAKPEADDSELRDVLDRVALGPWARALEHGLDTVIGERGATLSGGQRQRIAISRALLRDPLVLVLDEATSELDHETEAQVLEAIEWARGDRTVITVAHRLEAAVEADEIFVLDKGRIVERGHHQDLIVANGLYAGLWRRHRDVLGEVRGGEHPTSG